MRQSTRGVQYTPKATYTDFSKGMEYTAHAKDNNNPRAQLIKNMEIAPDGRLKVRRPLVPVLRNKTVDASLSAIPEGHTKLKTFYAPFRGLDYPYITFVWDGSDDLANKQSRVYLNWVDNETLHSKPNVLYDDLIFDNTGGKAGLERDIEGVFIPGQNILTLNTFNGAINLTINPGQEDPIVVRPSIHNTTIQEIRDYGVNLYGRDPLFVPNNITYEQIPSVEIQSILPYKLRDRAIGYSKDDLSFAPENWVFDVAPQGTDTIALKPYLEVPTRWLIFEIETFLSVKPQIIAGKTFYEWVWKTDPDNSSQTMEAVLRSGLGEKDLNQSALFKYSPSWAWFVSDPVDPQAGSTQTQPKVGKESRMPIFFSFLNGGSDMDEFEVLAKNTLSNSALDLVGTTFLNSINSLVASVLVGNNRIWRPDILHVDNAFNERLYNLHIIFGSQFVTELEEVVMPKAASGVNGIRGLKVYSNANNDNVFNILGAIGNVDDNIITAFDPQSAQTLIATPSHYVSGFAMGVEFGNDQTAGMSETYGFVLHMPEFSSNYTDPIRSRLNTYHLAERKSPDRDPKVATFKRLHYPGVFTTWNDYTDIYFQDIALNTYTNMYDAGNVNTAFRQIYDITGWSGRIF